MSFELKCQLWVDGTRHVVFIMGCQTLNNQWTQRMYLEQQRVAHAVTTPGGGGDGVGSCSGFAVTFVHRAPWSYRVFTRESGHEFAYANHVVGFNAVARRAPRLHAPAAR